jgi:hypothetical protein
MLSKMRYRLKCERCGDRKQLVVRLLDPSQRTGNLVRLFGRKISGYKPRGSTAAGNIEPPRFSCAAIQVMPDQGPCRKFDQYATIDRTPPATSWNAQHRIFEYLDSQA